MFEKVEYWLELCEDDLKTANILLENKQFLWMGFACHLIAEKAIKAAIASKTSDIPPKTHKLDKLAEQCGVYSELNETQKDLLDKLIPLQIEGRYPEYKNRINMLLTQQYCEQLLLETEGFVCWIKAWLKKSLNNIQTK